MTNHIKEILFAFTDAEVEFVGGRRRCSRPKNPSARWPSADRRISATIRILPPYTRASARMAVRSRDVRLRVQSQGEF
jgi:hypothetical protein